jgi:steroid Delta-isomerase
MAALYAHDGVLETPAVLALWPEREDAVVHSRDAIARFFAQSFQARSGEAVFEDWFRSGRYFSDGRLLIWEYPRETPKGDQTDMVESMDLENGLITHHASTGDGWGSASSTTPSTRPAGADDGDGQDSSAGVPDDQPAGIQSPFGSVVCPTSIR